MPMKCPSGEQEPLSLTGEDRPTVGFNSIKFIFIYYIAKKYLHNRSRAVKNRFLVRKGS